MGHVTGSPPVLYFRSLERGAGLLEFIVIIPVLALLLAGAYEVSRAVHQYQVIMGIAYEASRSGTQLAPGALKAGCFSDQKMSLKWLDGNQRDPAYNQALHDLLLRVRYLFNLHQQDLSLHCDSSHSGFCSPDSDEPAVVAEIISPNPASGQDCGLGEVGRNTLAIRIQGVYSPALFPFVKIPIELHSRGFILANNTTFAPLSNPNPGGSCGGISMVMAHGMSDYTQYDGRSVLMKQSGRARVTRPVGTSDALDQQSLFSADIGDKIGCQGFASMYAPDMLLEY